MNKNRQLSILEGPIWSALIFFALPIAFSNLLQQLFNAADQVVVGRFAGATALAAVGANSPIIALLVNVFSACAIGANALMARKIGEGAKGIINRIVHTSITFSMITGVLLLVFGQLVAGPMLRLIGTPEDVLPSAIVYLRIYAFAFPFILIFNFGSAILRSIGDTKRPMIALVSAGVVNLLLNLVFVIGFHMGVAGVAAATTISNLVACLAVIWFLHQETGDLQLCFHKLHINTTCLNQILQIGGPAALQAAVFSIANICIQSGINSLGADVMAGSSIISNFESIGYFVITAFCQAATTFCGQNYGAGNKERCRKIIVLALVESMLFSAIIDFSSIIFRYPLIQLFTSESGVVEAAVMKMFLVMTLHSTISLYEIPGAALRSMGRAVVPALLTVIGCVAFRVLWLATIFNIFHSLTALMTVYPASWMLTSILTWIYYFRVRKHVYGYSNRK